MSVPLDSAPRRVPPPCWTREETLQLIEAYSDRWYSVNRGNLRAADWGVVAAELAVYTPADPPKSAIQCRHKIEKLRKRYRTEQQRCLNNPGRFPSWDLFPFLDAMDIGSVGSKQDEDLAEVNDMVDGLRVKTLADRYLVAPKKYGNVDRDFEPDLDLNPDLALRARKYSKMNGDSNLNFSFDRDFRSGFHVEPLSDKNSVSVAFRSKNYGMADGTFKANADNYYDNGGGFGMRVGKTERAKKFRQSPNNGNGSDGPSGFPVNTFGNRNSMPPWFKPKKCRKVDGKSSPNFGGGGGLYNDSIDDINDRRDLFWKEIVDDWSAAPFTSKNNCKISESSNSMYDVDSKVLNGCKDAKMDGIPHSVKRGVDPIGEVVSSIKLLTEAFVNVEKMKMETAMEMEKMKMEMEWKHNQMLMESHKQVVDAFAKAMLQKKKKQKNVEVSSQVSDRNQDSQAAETHFESIGK